MAACLLEAELDERILDLVDRDLGAEHADLARLGVDPDMDVLIPGDAPIGGLDAVLDRVDQLLPGDLLLGVQLEEGTDEIATHDASSLLNISGGRQKETRGSPARSGRSVATNYTPGSVDGSSSARPD